MFYFDPFYMMVMILGSILVFVPQMWLRNVFAKFNEVPNSRRQSGAEVARAILRSQGLSNVGVEAVPGELTDHYDPTSRTVRLSENNYSGDSIAAAAVAAHEVGHAIQHAQGYSPLVLRASLAPVFGLGSQLGPLLLMISLGIMATSHAVPQWALTLAWAGVALYGSTVLFHLVTLPVEINASQRATTILATSHYLTPQEMPGAKKVLTAAAMTYVATALYALMQLLYFVFRVLALSGSRDRD